MHIYAVYIHNICILILFKYIHIYYTIHIYICTHSHRQTQTQTHTGLYSEFSLTFFSLYSGALQTPRCPLVAPLSHPPNYVHYTHIYIQFTYTDADRQRHRGRA